MSVPVGCRTTCTRPKACCKFEKCGCFAFGPAVGNTQDGLWFVHSHACILCFMAVEQMQWRLLALP